MARCRRRGAAGERRAALHWGLAAPGSLRQQRRPALARRAGPLPGIPYTVLTSLPLNFCLPRFCEGAEPLVPSARRVVRASRFSSRLLLNDCMYDLLAPHSAGVAGMGGCSQAHPQPVLTFHYQLCHLCAGLQAPRHAQHRACVAFPPLGGACLPDTLRIAMVSGLARDLAHLKSSSLQVVRWAQPGMAVAVTSIVSNGLYLQKHI